MSLKGKVAIVTGASRGLGAGMALELAQKGASVMLLYTSDSSTPQITALLPQIASPPHSPPATSCQADLPVPSPPSTVLAALSAWPAAEAGKLDILINSAGTELNAPLGSITPSDFASVYDLNVRAPLLLTQALLPHLNPRARIINISSVGARAGFAGLGLYCSSKAALEGLTRCWARELGGDGTTVNCVAPGPVKSDMLDNIPREIVEMQMAQTPVEGRVGSVEEVARIVGWLAGEEAAWVSGQVVSASGGWAMY
ncbi:3-oxoacyl-(acyl-carrier-protein) reductase [Colletotrichum kahawae]|uniref:3-oxoacyl-(Acyl-carrier-protein) reductase n=1 Tax=Colletotrichum kahawae TaxID=34407 RepID=A0AAD9YR14_COLKA|nr:3-oxoacyl-(acyl-carrier-protein) reductase [Colletotrichum kahawae]